MSDRLSRQDAYAAIRVWYQANTDKLHDPDSEYGRASLALIRALPAPEIASEAEISAVFKHIVSMYLEWGYCHSDGRMEMHEYVRRSIGTRWNEITEEELEQLRASRLFPYLRLK